MEALLGLVDAAQACGAFSLDVETTGTDVRNDHLVCISFCVKDKTWFLPLHQLPNSVPLIQARDWLNNNLFNRSDLSLIGHNVKFDILVLKNHGFVVQNKLIDTMLAEYVTNEYGAALFGAKKGIFGLKELVKKYFGIERPSWEEVKHLVLLSPKEFEQYSRDDARDTWRLWHEVEIPALAREGPKIEKLFYQMEMPLVRVLVEMESSGLYVDVVGIEKILESNARKIQKLEQEIYKQAKKVFNVASSEQLSDVLFHDLKIPPGDIPTISKSTPDHPIYSTNKDFIKRLKGEHPIVPLIIAWRKAVKIQTGFLNPILDRAKASEEQRIYPHFKQTGTVIGRLSSENPNSQNMPRKGKEKGVRDCIVAPPGKVLVVGDLNQIEYRVLAHQSNDPVLITAYLSGSDMHSATMKIVGCERTLAKNVNFGLTYGMTIPSLAEFLGVSEDRAKLIYDKVYGAFKEVPKYKASVRYEVMKKRFVETLFGRRRRFFGMKLTEFNHRQAFHFKIAGTAADIIKIGMNKLFQRLEAKRAEDPRWREVRMLVQVHDELVLEAPEEIAEEVRNLVKFSMEDVGGGKLRIPVKAEVGFGKTWSTAKQ